jgi:hypothetical protein
VRRTSVRLRGGSSTRLPQPPGNGGDVAPW